MKGRYPPPHTGSTAQKCNYRINYEMDNNRSKSINIKSIGMAIQNKGILANGEFQTLKVDRWT